MTTIPGDTTSQEVLTFGQPVNGTFDFNNDDDWYRVTLMQGFTYNFRLTAESGQVRILTDGGFNLGADSVGGFADPANLGFTADRNGLFFVAAEEVGTNALVSAYTLEGDDSDAQTDGPGTVGTVTPGGSVQARLDAPQDRDWFGVDLVEGVMYVISMVGRLDNQVEVRGAAGDLILSDRSFSTAPAEVVFVPDQSGTFFIVADDRDESIGNYTVEVSGGDGQSDGLTRTGTIAVGEAVADTMEASGDRDWFGIQLVAGVNYTFRVEGFTDNGIELRDDLGNFINSDRSFDTSPAEIEFTPNRTGLFHLVVDDRDNNTSPYTLTAFETVVGPPGNRAPEAVNDTASTPPGIAIDIPVVGNDTDPDGDLLVLLDLSDARNGSTRIDNGLARYTPDPGYQGIDSFTYVVEDGPGSRDVGLVAVTVGTPPLGEAQNGVIRNTDRDDVITIAQNATYLGGDGVDTYLVSQAVKADAISIIEDNGDNRVQLIDGLQIVASQAGSGNLRLILANGADLRILNADEMVFEVGGNATTATEGIVQSFTTFTEQTLGIAPGTSSGGPVIIEGPEPPAALEAPALEDDPFLLG